MACKDPKDYLWRNICSLMGTDAPTIDAVQARLEIGRGTVQRIKAGETSVGTDTLKQIAERFGIEVWQLLLPGLKLPDQDDQQALTRRAVNLAIFFDKLPEDDATRATAYRGAIEAIQGARRELLAKPTPTLDPILIAGKPP